MKNKITKILGLMGLMLLAFPNPANAAKMALSPATGNFSANCPIALNIIVNTEGKDTMASDAFLRYDPNQIEIVDQMGGVGGTQIKPGSIYESYPGNIVSNGVIRVTAFNREGYYNGRGILGSIIFKAKPGVSSASVNFDFSPGRTTDSNVAFTDSGDILNAAYGGNYTFKPGKCGGDSTPPTLEEISPAPDAVGAPLDSIISFVIRDNLSGVDLKTLKIQVNDVTYTRDGNPRFTFDGKPLKYNISVDPEKNFLDHTPVVIKINAQDLDGNLMLEKKYAFNELMPVTACQPTTIVKTTLEPPLRPASSVATETRPAAPESITVGLSDWWPWWFVLFCSLILNLKLWSDRQRKQDQKIPTVEGFERHSIPPAIRPIKAGRKKIK